MNSENGSGKTAKVLLTGRSQKLVNEVEALLKGSYMIEKCPVKGDAVPKALSKIHPDILIICLHEENDDIYKNYGVLITDMAFAETPVIVIGNGDDCFEFMCKLPAENLETLSVPLNTEKFEDIFQRFLNQSSQKLPWEMEIEDFSMDEMEEFDSQYNSSQYSQSSQTNQTIKPTKSENKKCILVVDDDVRMLNIIKMYLEDLYDVAVVPSGRLALKYLEKKPADLVLLDYMMPEMDGPSVLREIRTHSRNYKVPVVFLTGVSDKDDVMRGLDLRPNSYLLKPVSKEMLIERVQGILRDL